jgi:hypothetical protein
MGLGVALGEWERGLWHLFRGHALPSRCARRNTIGMASASTAPPPRRPITVKANVSYRRLFLTSTE